MAGINRPALMNEGVASLDQSQIQEFMELMRQHIACYKEFLALENQKFEDMSQNRLEKLDQHVKKEEAYLLKAKGLERTRELFLEQFGMGDYTMTQVIASFPSSEKEEATILFNELSELLLDLKQSNTRGNFLAELRLRRIQGILKKLEGNPEMQKLYTQHAKQTGKNAEWISQKV